MDEGCGREVRLTIPPEVRYLRLVRLTASGMAADLGFPLDAVEDLRVAVDELAAVLIDGSSAPLVVRFVVDDGRFVIEGCSTHPEPVHVDDVAREVLAMTADDYEVDGGPAGRWFRISVGMHGA